MKKLIIFMIMIMLFTSCNKNENPDTNIENNNENEIQDKELSIEDYFPFKENVKYSYEGEGNEFATFTVHNDYITEDRIQTRTNNGGTETVKVIEIKDGQATVIMSRGETYFRQNFTDIEKGDGEVLLKEPLEEGKSWTTANNIKRTITGINKEIETPYGSFEAIEVTTEGENYTAVDYYAKNTGLVKTIYKGDDYEVSSSLSSIEENTPLVQNITLYYPDIDGITLNTIQVPVTFNTNDEPKDLLENAIKNMSEYKVLSENAVINRLYYFEESNSVYVDFSKELVDEMNAGSGFEAMILQSITNTLGTYYGVEDIYITVDGNPYESGHILRKADEPFKVDLENVKVAN